MEAMLGQLVVVPFNFVPKGFLACNGQLLQISQYTALFSLMGTNFGGDGRTTFALPNLAGPAANLQYIINVSGYFPSRD